MNRRDCVKAKDYGKLIFYDPYTDKGNDANDGLSPETPVATPDRVLALAEESTPRTFTSNGMARSGSA